MTPAFGLLPSSKDMQLSLSQPIRNEVGKWLRVLLIRYPPIAKMRVPTMVPAQVCAMAV